MNLVFIVFNVLSSGFVVVVCSRWHCKSRTRFRGGVDRKGKVRGQFVNFTFCTFSRFVHLMNMLNI